MDFNYEQKRAEKFDAINVNWRAVGNVGLLECRKRVTSLHIHVLNFFCLSECVGVCVCVEKFDAAYAKQKNCFDRIY